jgi:molybdopterin-guanine dinucleotide biosynthesis protein A
LSGTPKSGLQVHGRTLLEHTLDALGQCRHIVVVGAVPEGVTLPRRILVTREAPLFGGPAAGVAAGVAVLASIVHHHSDVTVVLACDMPEVREAVPLLLGALSQREDRDGVIAVDSSGAVQPLAAVYRTDSLRRAIAAQATVEGLSMRALVSSLRLQRVTVPDRFLEDVDTWADAARFGIAQGDVTTAPAAAGDTVVADEDPRGSGTPTDGKSGDAELVVWANDLSRELGLSGVTINIDSILGLAGKVAHTVVRPAAPLTTFLVGYAAGRATAGIDPDEAISAASATALRLSKQYAANTSLTDTHVDRSADRRTDPLKQPQPRE